MASKVKAAGNPAAAKKSKRKAAPRMAKPTVRVVRPRGMSARGR